MYSKLTCFASVRIDLAVEHRPFGVGCLTESPITVGTPGKVVNI